LYSSLILREINKIIS